MLLACSMVSLTGKRPKMSSSSSCLFAVGKASSRPTKLSKPPPSPPSFAWAFLASALRKAMTSLMLMEGAGTGGGGACSATLCLTGVAERGVDCVRARTGAGLLAPATRDLDGVEGVLIEERDG